VGHRLTLKPRLLAAVVLLLAGTPASQAADLIWNAGTGTWDTATANWTGDATVFTDGGVDNVTFNQATGGARTITIAPGMTPLGTLVDNTGSSQYIFTGSAVSIDGGTLTKNGAGQLDINTAGLLAGVDLVVNAGTLRLPTQQTVPSLSGSGGTINYQGGGITIGGDNTSTGWTGSTSGHGSLTKNGSGTFTFTGVGANNSFSAGLNINAGTFRLGASNTIADGSTPSVKDVATLDLNGFQETLGSVTMQGGSTILGNGGRLTLTAASRPFSGLGGGTGAIALVASDVHFSSASRVDLDIRTNGSGAGIRQVFDGVISGASGGIGSTGNTSGLAVLQLAGTAPNTFTGDFTYDRGTIELNKPAGVDAIPTNIAISNGGTLKWLASEQIADTATLAVHSGNINLNGQNETVARLASGGTGQFDPSGSGLLTLAASSGDLISIGTGLNITKRLGIDLALSGSGGGILFTAAANQNRIMQIGTDTIGQRTLDLGPAVRTITVTDGPLTPDARIYSQITGAGGITKDGTGTLQLSAANTFRGNTTVAGGTLLLSNNLALENSAFDPSGAGALAFSTGINTPTFGGLTGAANLALPGNITALTLNPGTAVSHTYTGDLSGGAAGMTLTKTGDGTQTLGANQNYTGATNVNAGTLRVDGSIAASATTTVAAGATLSGGGTVGPLALQGGAVSPGSSIGTLSAGNTTWTDSSSVIFEIDDATGTAGAAGGPGWDLLDIAGTLDLSALGAGGFTIRVDTLLAGGGANPGEMAHFVDSSDYAWEFVRASGGILGPFEASDFLLDTSGLANSFTGAFAISNIGDSLLLTYSAAASGVVPEPSSFVLLGVGLVILALRFQRRGRDGQGV